MTKCIDFYFDFISPYSYLAFKKIKSLQNKDQINFNYKPILLGGLHNLGGVIAPAFNERKMKNMKNDCELIAKKNNIDFKWNNNFPINSLYLMRGYIFIENEKKEKFFEVCFDSYWKENLDISQSINLNKILDKCKINQENFHNGIKDLKIKNELKELTNKAFKLDVFGAPTFLINDKLFWGQDRLAYALEEYIS
tara:strand:- start:905 stop:1489 length:585 start_codon:yes stop_codon:yes gene_type:complete